MGMSLDYNQLWRVLAAGASAIFLFAFISPTPSRPSANDNLVQLQEGVPPEILRVAVEFSDSRLLSDLAGVACTSWVNSFPHVVIYSDSYTRENLPPESSAARDCGSHVEFSSITSMTIDSLGRSTHLGDGIDLSQLKREVVVKDMARRLAEDRSADKRTWALLTEEDTWWNVDHLLRLLHRIERDTGFDRSDVAAKLPPTLAGAGYVESDADDIVYGPMMIMTHSLLTEIADRLDTCRIHAARHCFQHQRHEVTGELNPWALHHPDPSSGNIFIPDFALEMAAKTQSDKTVLKCQKSPLPVCSALCSRRMDVYDGALYNNDHFISMCAHHVPGIRSVVVRSLQPHGYAFYGDQVLTVDDSESAVYTMKRNCQARCIYGSASGNGPNGMSKAEKAEASVILSCGERIKWYQQSKDSEKIEAIDQVNRQCLGQCFCEGGSDDVEKELEDILYQRRIEADRLREERLKTAAAGGKGERYFFMQNYNEKGTMPTQEPNEVSPAHLKLVVAYHKCYESCQRFLSSYDYTTESEKMEVDKSPVNFFTQLVGHLFGTHSQVDVKSEGTVFSAGKGENPYVCRVGKDLNEYQVPTVILAGVQKSATSTLFWQMVAEFKVILGRGEITTIGFGDAFDDEPAYFAKEKHFFSRWNPEDAVTPEWTGSSKGKNDNSSGGTGGGTGLSLSASSQGVYWTLDKNWFEERIRSDIARTESGDISADTSTETGCCPAAQIMYDVGSDRSKDRCCTEKRGHITPLRPLGGTTWSEYASRCRDIRTGGAPLEGLCSMLIVGDSLAEQHFISLVCLAWAETGQDVRLKREAVPGEGWDASTWHAYIAPYDIKLSFSRSDEPRLLNHIKYQNYDFLLLSSWRHEYENGWFRAYLKEIEEVRHAHPSAHTLFFEATPAHFPGGKYNDDGTYPAAVSAEDAAVCDMSMSGDKLSSHVNSEVLDQKADNASFGVIHLTKLFMSRGDAHPGITKGGRGGFQYRDCVHWCVVPGVLDGMALATLESVLGQEKAHRQLRRWPNHGARANSKKRTVRLSDNSRRLTAVEARFEDVSGVSALRYLQHYPKCSDEKTLLMDGTPNYFFTPQSPLRMLQFYGGQFSKVKTIVMLRDPTERFESYFNHAHDQGFLDSSVMHLNSNVQTLNAGSNALIKGLESISFADYASLSLQQANKCISEIPWEPLWPNCGTEGIFSGLYALQFSHWLRYFEPSQVAVIPTGAFELNNTIVMEELATFVGVQYSKLSTGQFARKNDGTFKYGKVMAVEDEPLRLALDAFYEDDKIETRELLRISGMRLIPEIGGWKQFLNAKSRSYRTRRARHLQTYPPSP